MTSTEELDRLKNMILVFGLVISTTLHFSLLALLCQDNIFSYLFKDKTCAHFLLAKLMDMDLSTVLWSLL